MDHWEVGNTYIKMLNFFKRLFSKSGENDQEKPGPEYVSSKNELQEEPVIIDEDLNTVFIAKENECSFDDIISKAQTCLKEGDTNEAFRLVVKADSILSPDLPRFEYIKKLSSSTYLSSEICLKEGKHKDYIYYYVFNYILSFASDLTEFPISLHRFKHREKLTREGKWGLESDDIIEEYSKSGIQKDIDEYINDLTDFCLNQLPILMDIPKLALEKESLNQSDYIDLFGKEQYEILDEYRNQKRFTIVSEINKFINNISQ